MNFSKRSWVHQRASESQRVRQQRERSRKCIHAPYKHRAKCTCCRLSYLYVGDKTLKTAVWKERMLVPLYVADDQLFAIRMILIKSSLIFYRSARQPLCSCERTYEWSTVHQHFNTTFWLTGIESHLSNMPFGHESIFQILNPHPPLRCHATPMVSGDSLWAADSYVTSNPVPGTNLTPPNTSLRH